MRSPDKNSPKFSWSNLGKTESLLLLDQDDPASGQTRAETVGHVTSLAVQKDYRRLGLAEAMMTQLHRNLRHQGARSCGLHVRTSNLAACRLYEKDGYDISAIIPSYYRDGEDAYLMKKGLKPIAESKSFPRSTVKTNELLWAPN